MNPGDALLIANPGAGRLRGRGTDFFAPLTAAFKARGTPLQIAFSRSVGEAEAMSRQAAAAGAALVIAAGGDGTINRIALPLIGSPTALALIPCGTVNVLARALGMPLRPAAAMEKILAGGERDYWPGMVNGKPFLSMAGLGLDAAIVAAADIGLKKKIGRMVYPWTGLRRFDALPKAALTGSRISRPAGWIIAGCTPLYGGSYRLSPDAETFGKTLGLLAVHAESRLELLRLIGALVMRGGRLPEKNPLFTRGAGVDFDFAAGQQCDFQLDGEWAGRAANFAIRVSPLPLRVWV